MLYSLKVQILLRHQNHPLIQPHPLIFYHFNNDIEFQRIINQNFFERYKLITVLLPLYINFVRLQFYCTTL